VGSIVGLRRGAEIWQGAGRQGTLFVVPDSAEQPWNVGVLPDAPRCVAGQVWINVSRELAETGTGTGRSGWLVPSLAGYNQPPSGPSGNMSGQADYNNRVPGVYIKNGPRNIFVRITESVRDLASINLADDFETQFATIGNYTIRLFDSVDYSGLEKDKIGTYHDGFEGRGSNVSSILVERIALSPNPSLNCNGVYQGVIIWSSRDFTGTCRVLTADESDLGRIGMNDNVGSIAINGPYRAWLYEHPGYSGNYDIMSWGDGNMFDNRFGNGTSSMRVRRYDMDLSQEGVWLCAQPNYNGVCEVFRADDSELSNNAVGNDETYSCWVNGAYSGKIYLDLGMTGASVDCAAGVPDLRGSAVGNGASSVRVVAYPPPVVPTITPTPEATATQTATPRPTVTSTPTPPTSTPQAPSSTVPAGAQFLGGLDIARYCRETYNMAESRVGDGALDWRCQTPSGPVAPDFQAAARRQYGNPAAVAGYRDINQWYSWGAYAPQAGPTPVATALTCPASRPAVGISNQLTAPGTLTVTVTAGAGSVRQLRFDGLQNARIDAGNLSGQVTAFTYSPPQALSSISFALRQVDQAQAATVNLTVVDGCGDWSTLVGGGAAGFWPSTAVPTVSATPTRTPTPTQTPSPSSALLIDDFQRGIGSWTALGPVATAQEGSNTFLRFQPNGNGPEASHALAGVRLRDYRAVQLRINPRGARLLGGDASALYFSQGGNWRFLGLSDRVQAGSSAWATITIPLDQFPNLNRDLPVDTVGIRIWLGSASTIDVDDLQLVP
jgi:hypothetical protein